MTRLLTLLLVLCASPLYAQTYTIAPAAYQTVLNASGAPVSGACIWTYVAGTSTPVTTYSTSSGTANSNPIEADSAGRFTVYLAPGSSYKFIFENDCTPPAHASVIKTVDSAARGR
jgi:hypothetical protein